jgi:hypothetical protein
VNEFIPVCISSGSVVQAARPRSLERDDNSILDLIVDSARFEEIPSSQLFVPILRFQEIGCSAFYILEDFALPGHSRLSTAFVPNQKNDGPLEVATVCEIENEESAERVSHIQSNRRSRSLFLGSVPYLKAEWHFGSAVFTAPD